MTTQNATVLLNWSIICDAPSWDGLEYEFFWVSDGNIEIISCGFV